MAQKLPPKFAGLIAVLSLATGPAVAPAAASVVWDSSYDGNYLAQPPEWYASAEAARIADSVLLYQRSNGGWPKGKEMTADLSGKVRERVLAEKRRDDTTLDNGATHKQIRYLAHVAHATGAERFAQGVLRGIDFLLAAQYPNGGWPQFHPNHTDHNDRNSAHNPRGLSAFITFNDGAIVGALEVLRDAERAAPPFELVDPGRRARARQAVERAVDLIIRLQLRDGGTPSAWAAQYDEQTLEPRWGRRFEPVALASRESVEIARFLMSLEDPDLRVKDAVRGTMAWFDRVRIVGFCEVVDPRPIQVRGRDGQRVSYGDSRHERTLVRDPAAPPLWARFYEIGTNRPVFASDDDTVRYAISELTVERRTGYEWYGQWPRPLLDEEYPAWRKRHGLAPRR